MTPYLQQRTLYPPLIQMKPSLNLGIVVVIPAYNEPDVIFSLMALHKCVLTKEDIEVIIVFNDGENESATIKEFNQEMFEKTQYWATQNYRSEMRFHPLYISDLAKKFAGVGLARKIGMDEAALRLERVGNKNGIIVCFDADSKCEKNYFTAIEDYFSTNENINACSIHFEHPLSGYDFSEDTYKAITLYELHLRYYVNAQRYAGFPFAVQTVGSSMAVRSSTYQQQGGMNKRKAGEDFYFLHKFTPLGGFGELNTTKVIPSPRSSDRVPFGTGKEIGKLLETSLKCETYAFESFEDLKLFFEKVPQLFHLEETDFDAFVEALPKSIQAFLQEQNFKGKWEEIKQNTTNEATFINRFYRWFNAFLLMKYVHFARDHYYPNVDVLTASQKLFSVLYQTEKTEKSAKDLLLQLREIDRESTFVKTISFA